MKEQFADYETSKMLKELGFDEPCYGYYFLHGRERETLPNKNSDIPQACTSRVLWQQVEQWLWEKDKIRIVVQPIELDDPPFMVHVCFKERDITSGQNFNSPITAKTEGIKAAVKSLHEQLKHKA